VSQAKRAAPSAESNGRAEGVANADGDGGRKSGGECRANEEEAASGNVTTATRRAIEETAVGVLGRGNASTATVDNDPAKVLGDSATCFGVSNATRMATELR
jgi:hypothetical protein